MIQTISHFFHAQASGILDDGMLLPRHHRCILAGYGYAGARNHLPSAEFWFQPTLNPSGTQDFLYPAHGFLTTTISSRNCKSENQMRSRHALWGNNYCMSLGMWLYIQKSQMFFIIIYFMCGISPFPILQEDAVVHQGSISQLILFIFPFSRRCHRPAVGIKSISPIIISNENIYRKICLKSFLHYIFLPLYRYAFRTMCRHRPCRLPKLRSTLRRWLTNG